MRLKNLLEEMRYTFIKGKKIHEKDAKDIAHEFMRIFKNGINLNTENVLVNPSIFSTLFIINKESFKFELIGETFKKMSFPHFCYGLIEYSDMIITHGYMINSYAKHMLQEQLYKKN
jgi:hypothetical protein